MKIITNLLIILLITYSSVFAQDILTESKIDPRITNIENKIRRLESPQRRMVVVTDEIDYLYFIHFPDDRRRLEKSEQKEKITDRYEKIAKGRIAQQTKSIDKELKLIPMDLQRIENSKTTTNNQISIDKSTLDEYIIKYSEAKKQLNDLRFIAENEASDSFNNKTDAEKITYFDKKNKFESTNNNLQELINQINELNKNIKDNQIIINEIENKIVNLKIKDIELTSSKNYICNNELDVSIVEMEIKILEYVYGIFTVPDAASFYDRIKAIYNKMDISDFDRERVRFGIALGSTTKSSASIFASAVIKAYFSSHQYVPGHWFDWGSFGRRLSIFFGVGDSISESDSVSDIGPFYTIGMGIDINPDFTLGVGYSIYNFQYEDQTSKRDEACTINLILSSSVFTKLMGVKE